MPDDGKGIGIRKCPTALSYFISALNKGLLVRPSTCSACGVRCVPDAHHDNYDAPLRVLWICRKCHGQKRRHMKKAPVPSKRHLIPIELAEALEVMMRAHRKPRQATGLPRVRNNYPRGTVSLAAEILAGAGTPTQLSVVSQVATGRLDKLYYCDVIGAIKRAAKQLSARRHPDGPKVKAVKP